MALPKVSVCLRDLVQEGYRTKSDGSYNGVACERIGFTLDRMFLGEKRRSVGKIWSLVGGKTI